MTQAFLSRFVKNADGSVKCVWEDGHSTSYPSLADLKADLAQLDGDQTIAERWLLAWFLARQPDASNVNIVEGKRITLDASASNPLRVQ